MPPAAQRAAAQRNSGRAPRHELVDEIVAAARSITTARNWSGDLVFRTDGVWRVLTTVASSPYCLAIADLGRALRVRKQVAHELAHETAKAGLIELATNHQDRRILQALITPRGRAELAAARIAESRLLAALTLGLGDHELTQTTHVVRVIRQRLERAARELAERTTKG